MNEVVITSAVRTPIGNFGGTLRDISTVQLGSKAINEALRKNNLRPIPPEASAKYRPEHLDRDMTELEKKYCVWDNSCREIEIDEVIMGNVLQAGQGQNVARQAAVYAGLPIEVNAYTVNKVCGSGLKAISLAAQAIMTGTAKAIVAGGMESMSNVPYALPRARWGYRMDLSGHADMQDLLVMDGLFESFYGYHMGVTAENIAQKYKITRLEQDELGLLSHQRACAAIRDGIFKAETIPISILQKKGEIKIFEIDERPMETSIEKMSKLKPVFKKGGTVTAGNSSGITDAAAAVLVMNKEESKRLGIEPLAQIIAYASGGVDPAYMGLGPVPAIRKALEIAKISLNDIDVIELNEAFAAQAIACMRELKLSIDNTNIHGSGISLGHPIGCTGTRIIVTLLHEMNRRDAKYGLAALCIGGGQGMAMILTRAKNAN